MSLPTNQVPAENAQTTVLAQSTKETVKKLPDGSVHEIVQHTSVVQFEQELSERHKRTPPIWEISFGILLISLWLFLFGGGIFVPTGDFRKLLLGSSGDLNLVQRLQYGAVVICFYTVTNIFFLSLLSSCIGCMTCRWRVTGQLEGLMSFYAGLHAKRIYLAALLRGFFLYLMVISGFLVLSTEEAIVQTGFAQYIRVAGLTSILGFMVGYDPQIAYRLMGKLNDLANQPLKQDLEAEFRRQQKSNQSLHLTGEAKVVSATTHPPPVDASGR